MIQAQAAVSMTGLTGVVQTRGSADMSSLRT
jgi:hypothetical protein